MDMEKRAALEKIEAQAKALTESQHQISQLYKEIISLERQLNLSVAFNRQLVSDREFTDLVN